MKYSFDILKSRHIAALYMLGVMLVPIFLLALLHAPALREYIPGFLYRSLLLPLGLQVVAPIFLIYNKKYLFWKNVSIVLDKVNAKLNINSKQYSLKDMEYYELKEGSLLTSGDRRDFLILKFKSGKSIEIVPCRTSENVSNYDAFAAHFLNFVDKHFEEDKEKPENKTTKRVAVALLLAAHICFFCVIVRVWFSCC